MIWRRRARRRIAPFSLLWPRLALISRNGRKRANDRSHLRLAPKTTIASLKRFASAFHHTAHLLAHPAFLQRALVHDPTLPGAKIQGTQHLRIAIDHDVWVVGDDDNLAPEFVSADLPDDQVVDQVIVKVVLRLVEDEGL